MTQDPEENRSATVHSEQTGHSKERLPTQPRDTEHEGATEGEVTPTPPPTGPEYEDEPKQG